MEKIKIKFKRDFAPFKKDDTVETDKRQSDWYIGNGIAELACGCAEGKEECEDCKGKNAKAEEVVVDDVAADVVADDVVAKDVKKKTSKK